MMTNSLFHFSAVCLVAMVLMSADRAGGAEPKPGGKLRVYVGTYTRAESRGIYQFDLDPASGATQQVHLAAETVNPSFLAVHPSKRFLYAVGEIGNYHGKKTGAVNSFSVDPHSGKLTLLNQQPSGGAGPCHLVVDAKGKNVLVANYGGGSVAVLPINDDGRLGKATSVIQHEGSSVNPQRQQGPHAHSINLDAANRFAFAADLGLDKVLIYRFDPLHGKLTPHGEASVAPGSGPRHFAFHPSGKFAYVINELASTVTAFRYDGRAGRLETVQTISTLPQDFEGENWTAEVQVHPSGRFVYGSNRGHDSIAIFSVDPATGRLTAVGHESTRGQTPRNFGIDPDGSLLLAANQNSDTIVLFRIDAKTGRLKMTGKPIDVPAPVCIKFVRLGE